MNRLFLPVTIGGAAMFAYAPFMILNAPYESTMGLVQKIVYFHAPIAMTMFLSAFVCGVASAKHLFRRTLRDDHVAVASAELTVLLGTIVLVTGPLWARKAWGIWWDWEPRLTMSFVGWMISVSYLFVRKYGGPGSDKLGAALAVFGAANVPFVYVSVNVWRTLHPKTSVVPKLPPLLRGPFWFSFFAILVLYLLLLAARVHLERQRATLDELYLEEES